MTRSMVEQLKSLPTEQSHAMSTASDIALLPDAGPLITLAYADALDLLFKPRWSVMLVDMVLHEVTRNQTPTSEKLAQWVKSNKLPVRITEDLPALPAEHWPQRAARKSNLGELAIQEAMNDFALEQPPKTGMFPVRGPQDCPRQFSGPGQLPQGQHASVPDLPRTERLA
jgi:hypothetical protein